MTFFDVNAVWNTVFGYVLMILAAAFSFYWGGMIAGYKAPFKRRIHGTIVAPVAFVISPTVNFLAGNGLFPGLKSIGALEIMLGVLVLSTVAAYVGSRRGEALHAYNQNYIRKRELRREHQRRQSQEG